MLELNKIYNTDCIEGMKQLDDNSIDMILCDPPYGITQCKWDKPLSLDKLWNEYKRISKKNTAIVLTASQPYTTELINSNRDWFRYEWIWEKTQPSGIANSNIMPMKSHENILVFYERKPIFNKQLEKRKCNVDSKERMKYKMTGNAGSNIYGYMNKVRTKYNPSLCNPRTVQRFDSIYNYGKNKLHPTQKPLSLFEYLIKTYSDEGDLVLDNCMGSGTTAVACKHLNRRFIGFEINKEYYNISLKRLLNVPERLENWIDV